MLDTLLRGETCSLGNLLPSALITRSKQFKPIPSKRANTADHPQFDMTDRDRHFALTVPGRAMFCPVLRYALLTASAGHMRQALKCRNNSNGTVIFDGIPLPGLSEDSAIRYHSICISYLIEISKDPNEDYNEDVLTAATILRFYEQLDGEHSPPPRHPKPSHS